MLAVQPLQAASRTRPVSAEPVAVQLRLLKQTVPLRAALSSRLQHKPAAQARTRQPACRAIRPPESETAGPIDWPAIPIRSGEDQASSHRSPITTRLVPAR